MSRSQPLVLLRELAERRATGELICATADVEVHVHLQEGRIAWATSTCTDFVFSRHMVQQCNIDMETFRALLQECRQQRKPLGETLVAWGVATEELVKSSLKRQIEESISSLGRGLVTDTLFLPRGVGYQTYNPQFTFELSTIRPRRRAKSSQRFPAPLLSPSSVLHTRLSALAENEHDLRWVEYHPRNGPRHRFPGGPHEGIDSFVNDVLDGRTIFVAVRRRVENLIGVELGHDTGTVWCGVAPDVVLGAMIIVLREHLQTQIVTAGEPGTPMGDATILEDRGLSSQTLTSLMKRAHEVWGVGLTDQHGATHDLALRRRLAPGSIGARVSPVHRLLQHLLRDDNSDPTQPADNSVFAISASAEGWLFGARLLDDTNRYLWLLLDPSAGQGLGWALLTTLLRQTSLTSREL